ncbi:MAG: NHL repeat-containing protein [Akkermansiaceae bacterium]|nr:NHL repeat-containing protein [Akkermansiaceae bacterium]MCP5546743.1 NHL repeat-containing protein [Akkermansiaceae bacterium]
MKLQHLIPIVLATAASAVAKTIPNHAIANLVLGQVDFVSDSSSSPASSFSFVRPEGVVIDPATGKVFVSEYENNRILRFPNYNSLTNGAGAEAVFGQTSFSNTSAGDGEQRLSGPVGLHLDRHGRLWVADDNNNRVLMFEAAVYRTNAPYADKVLGQPDFVTTTSAATAAKMSNPYGVWVDDNDRLWVADFGNNRVLRFDNVTSKSSGASADGVLGQPDFVTATSATTSSKFNRPESVSVSSSGTLYVAERNNRRVLRFDNAASLADGANASRVYGQLDFVSNSSGLTASTVSSLSGVLVTPDDTLWVNDRGNERLLRFDNISSKPSGAAADGVVGQKDFTSSDDTTSARGPIDAYGQPHLDPKGNLWIADTENNRVLRFPPDVTKPLLTVKKPAKKVTKKKLKVSGTASDQYGVAKVQYKLGKGAVKTASGTTSWSFNVKLAEGKNKLTVWSIDSVGNQSPAKTIKVKYKPKKKSSQKQLATR